MRDFRISLGRPCVFMHREAGGPLAMLDEGLAALVISHAPETEARYLREHLDWRYQKLAYNRFIAAGPSSDPAGIRADRSLSRAGPERV